MDRVLRLLKEYEDYRYNNTSEELREYHDRYDWELVDNWRVRIRVFWERPEFTDEWMVSRRYGFVKWLCDTDKVDQNYCPRYWRLANSSNVEVTDTYQMYTCAYMFLSKRDDKAEWILYLLK